MAAQVLPRALPTSLRARNGLPVWLTNELVDGEN